MTTYHFRVKNDTKPNGTKVSAKGHVDYILQEDAKAHAEYINRERTKAQESDCVFKEIEFSLPNELTLEQNREIVDRFIATHLASH